MLYSFSPSLTRLVPPEFCAVAPTLVLASVLAAPGDASPPGMTDDCNARVAGQYLCDAFDARVCGDAIPYNIDNRVGGRAHTVRTFGLWQ